MISARRLKLHKVKNCCFFFIFVRQSGAKNIDGNHEEAMFGAGGSIPDTAAQTTAPEVKIMSQPVISQSVDKEGLFASWVSLVYIL